MPRHGDTDPRKLTPRATPRPCPRVQRPFHPEKQKAHAPAASNPTIVCTRRDGHGYSAAPRDSQPHAVQISSVLRTDLANAADRHGHKLGPHRPGAPSDVASSTSVFPVLSRVQKQRAANQGRRRRTTSHMPRDPRPADVAPATSISVVRRARTSSKSTHTALGLPTSAAPEDSGHFKPDPCPAANSSLLSGGGGGGGGGWWVQPLPRASRQTPSPVPPVSSLLVHSP